MRKRQQSDREKSRVRNSPTQIIFEFIRNLIIPDWRGSGRPDLRWCTDSCAWERRGRPRSWFGRGRWGWGGWGWWSPSLPCRAWRRSGPGRSCWGTGSRRRGCGPRARRVWGAPGRFLVWPAYNTDGGWSVPMGIQIQMFKLYFLNKSCLKWYKFMFIVIKVKSLN